MFVQYLKIKKLKAIKYLTISELAHQKISYTLHNVIL